MQYRAPRVGIYLRVSTADQSCELQKRELLEYVKLRGWVKVELYEDRALSGTTINRPELRWLLSDARRRRVDVVCCWKLDRLFRSLKDLITTLQEFQELGISFVSIKDQVDMATSSGRLMMQVIGAFAEFEGSLIRERVRAGLKNARAKGKRLGRPKIRDDAKIHALRAQGLSIRNIAHRMRVSKGAVQRSIAH